MNVQVIVVVLFCYFCHVSCDTVVQLETLDETTPMPDETETTPSPTLVPEIVTSSTPSPVINSTTENTLLKNHNVSENVIVEGDFNPETWIAPREIQEEYPYFLSGFDDENRPIWIAQWGLFDMRKVIQLRQEPIVEKYVEQAAHVIIKSHGIRSTPENPVNTASFLIDFDGLKLEQVAHVPTIQFCLKLARLTRHLIEQYTHKIVVVNANYITELVINLARPILAGVFGRLEVYGTNRARWLPQVQKIFPKDQLPEYYGGYKNPNFKPLIIYG